MHATYGGTVFDVALSMVQTSDGGYAMTGYTDSTPGPGNYYFRLVKVAPITIAGDIDDDLDIDYDDLFILARAYGSSSGQPAYDARADFDNDDNVDYDDFIILATNYGTSV